MKKIEKELEDKCITFARSQGWDCWKNENNGNKGIPDHSLLSPDGRFIMVEFKASEKAHIRHEQLVWKERHDNVIFFIHSFDDFCELIKTK